MNGNVFKSPIKMVRLFLDEVRKGKVFKLRPKKRPIYFFNSPIFGRGSEIDKFETAGEKNRPIFWTRFTNGQVF